MNPLRWAMQSARHRGILRTTKIAGNVALDCLFDWKYGTDTLRWVEISALETVRDSHSHVVHHYAPYRATKAKPFLKLLRQLRLSHDSVFVDIGSGKGRVLLIASQHGFRKVVGVELSAELCAIARKNVDLFCRRMTHSSPIEVREADAAHYRFRPDENVLFMFNPFDSLILGKVVENIGHSLQEHPRDICLIYNTPRHHDLLKNSGLFRADSFYEIGGNQFCVYWT